MDDPSIGRRKDDVLESWDLSLRVPEEKGDEQGKKNPKVAKTVHPIPPKKRVRRAAMIRNGDPSLAIGH